MAKDKAPRKDNPDPQKEHARQFGGSSDPGDQIGNEEVNRVKVRVGEVGEKGVNILGHPLIEGHVIELLPDDVKRHQDAGVPLEDVEDFDGEVYDVHTPWVNPEHTDVEEQ